MENGKTPKLETATFACGCFWGVEDAFMQVKGVKETMAGYAGGHTKNPTYKEVCSNRTGHAEAVELKFDPKIVPFQKLLGIFWAIHDPTTFNRQGPDVGSQYRSAIFFHSEKQKELAEKSKKALEKSGKYKNKIVTKIVAAKEFFAAEEYHQKYNQKNGLPSCHVPL